MTEQLSLRSCKHALPSLLEMKTGQRSQGAVCTLCVHKKAFVLPFSLFRHSALFTPEPERSQRPSRPMSIKSADVLTQMEDKAIEKLCAIL